MLEKKILPVIISILILGIFGLSQESYAVQTPEFLFKFGTFGFDDGEFKGPTGLAFDNSDNLYVIENGNWRVQKFDDQGNFLLKWGSLCRLFNAGTGCIDPDGAGPLEISDGQFADPFGIEVDNNDKVYVSDKNNRRIQIFDSTGNFVLKFGKQVCDIEFPTNPGIQCVDPDGAGPLESGDGQFQLNRDVDVANSGNIYVADSENDRIQVFDSQGNYLFKFGTKCTQSGFGCMDPDGAGPLEIGDGQFHSARGIQIDSNENIYVADWDNHRIQVFDSNGNFLTKFGKNGGDRSSGSGDGEFVRPHDIAFDSSGNIYVADSYNHRIQVFDSNHNFLTKFGSFGTDDGKFKFPTDLEIHSSGTIYVADPGNHRIQVFGILNQSPEVTASLVPICGEDTEGLFQIQFTVTDDNDVNPNIVAELNGIPVENGQVVELEIDDEPESEFDDNVLEIEDSSFTLVVTATDSAGESTSVSTSPSFDGLIECEDNDDDDNDEDGDEDNDKEDEHNADNEEEDDKED